MTSGVESDETVSQVREWWVPTVSLMAVGVLTVVVWVQVPDTTYALFDIALPTAFASVAVWQGLRLRQADGFDDDGTVVRWFTLGLVVMAGLGLWPVVLQAAGQSTVPVGVRLLTEIIAGGLFGLVVGIYSVRARTSAQRATEAEVEQEFLERQREANDLLNRTLRHQLLNGLTVIRGRAELLASEGDDETNRLASTAVEKCDQLVGTVEEIATITQTMTEGADQGAVPLSDVVTVQAESVREEFPAASLTVESCPDCSVRADDLLEHALYNVLENAVEHNDTDRPTVAVDATRGDEMASVTVADDGQGIPEAARERIWEANERGLESEGAGLGLFLTASVVEQYGGDVRVGDSHLGGAEVELRLPLAEQEGAPDSERDTPADSHLQTLL